MYHLPITFGWAKNVAQEPSKSQAPKIPRWITELPEWDSTVASYLRNGMETGKLQPAEGNPMRSLANLKWAMHQAARDLKAASKESKSLGAHHELPLLILILCHIQEERWHRAEFLAGKVTEIRTMLEGLLEPDKKAYHHGSPPG